MSSNLTQDEVEAIEALQFLVNCYVMRADKKTWDAAIAQARAVIAALKAAHE